MRPVRPVLLASVSTFAAAPLKTCTARTRNQTSLETMKQMEAMGFLRQIPGVVGVGVPGGEKDEVCANAGLAKVERGRAQTGRGFATI